MKQKTNYGVKHRNGGKKMETWEGKNFSITDPKGVSTVIYQIIRTPKELLKEYPKYALQRLDSTDEIRGDMIRKTFYVDFPSIDQDELVILSFGKDRVVVNTAILDGNKVSISKKPMPLKESCQSFSPSHPYLKEDHAFC